MSLKITCLFAVLALLILCCSDDDDKNSNKDTNRAKTVTTSTGLTIKDGSITYDLKTRETTVSTILHENKKPKQGKSVDYTLLCGEPRYGAVEVKLKAISDSNGSAKVAKRSLSLDSNNTSRCALYITIDGESHNLIEGRPVARKMGNIQKLTLEEHTYNLLQSSYDARTVVVFDANGKPVAMIRKYPQSIGKELNIVVFPAHLKAYDSKMFRKEPIGGYHIGGMSAIYYDANAAVPAKAGQLKNCTPTTCWKYIFFHNPTNSDDPSAVAITPFKKGDIPGKEPRIKNKINLWIEKKGGNYRMWYFLPS